MVRVFCGFEKIILKGFVNMFLGQDPLPYLGVKGRIAGINVYRGNPYQGPERG